MVKLVTVKDIPLVKVGMWSASTGATPITTDTLSEIMEAHQSGMLDKGVLKKGHFDPRMNNPTWDGDPVYGQVDNLRLSEDGTTLLGDYVNVPEDLAETLPSAYPHRSVEIAWNVRLRDAAGNVARKFKAALSGVALLGRTPPAVKGLGGHTAALSAHIDGQTVEVGRSVVFSSTDFAFPGDMTSNGLREALSTALRAATEDGGDELGVWLEDFDDQHIWFRANRGLFQVSYTMGAGGAVELGDDITAVVEKRIFVPLGDTQRVPQAALSASDATDTTSTGPGATETTGNTDQEEAEMANFVEKLRVKLGLPDTATEDEILAANLTVAPPKAEESQTPATANPQTQTGTAETAATGEAPAGTATAESTTAASAGRHAAPGSTVEGENVVLSKAAFEQLMGEHRTLQSTVSTFSENQDKARRDALLNDFKKAGKVHPTEVQYFREQLDKDEQSTVTFLSAREGIPTSEIGHDEPGFEVATFSEDDFNKAASVFGLELKGANQ